MGELNDKEFEKQISLNYGRVIFLYFKALLLSDDYKQLVTLAGKGDIIAGPTIVRSQYPHFDRIHSFFDDVYQFGNSNTNKDIAEAFGKFIAQRSAYFDIPFTHRIEFIKNGQPIKAEAGTTYVTLPDPADIPLATELYGEAYKHVPASTNVALASLFPPMDGLSVYALDNSVLDTTARRLDAYVWLGEEKIDAEIAVRRAYESKAAHWADLRFSLYDTSTSPLKGTTKFAEEELEYHSKELERYSDESISVIANAIKGNFPSSK